MTDSLTDSSSDTAATPRPDSSGLIPTALLVIAWFGVLLQLWLSVQLAQANGKSIPAGLVVYLGYFTVLTNIFVALVLTCQVVVVSNRVGRFFTDPSTRACAATSIALVGLGYHFLLRQIWNPQGWQWVADIVLHYVTPILFSIYWLVALAKSDLKWWSPFAWCIYPVSYFAYALIRGAVLGAYPYPFIDVAAIGYVPVLRNAFGLLLVFILVGWLLIGLGQVVSGKRNALLNNR
ncbi:Pr6Pr family membrane protein [Undibacterium sp. Jales W-56]|uniref:Pr6Pr family membrane protein n=1 Tax=Undibacterium sp. Jales W-56 TaxID=2897325 RepID=UPI0021D2B543|nr:Pr6Pr family membrane protein [Undibacterium sp. Jales W-56]MCU6433960.1 Pr6Pr family membrane protein [Undibacterium sp. Jales W-56]